MPRIDETNINFAVYEDGTEYLGLAQADLPEIASLTNTISGAGIMGNYESVVIGAVDAMNTKITFRNVTDAAIRLARPGHHTIDLRVAQQSHDPSTGDVTITNVKHIMVVAPKKLALGSVKPHSPGDVSGEYSVRYFATYKDGRCVLEVDQANYKLVIDGVDYAEPIRKALGK